VQAAIYFPRVGQHPSLRVLLEGVIRTHAYYVLQVVRHHTSIVSGSPRCCTCNCKSGVDMLLNRFCSVGRIHTQTPSGHVGRRRKNGSPSSCGA
jgi:hypothetical protein